MKLRLSMAAIVAIILHVATPASAIRFDSLERGQRAVSLMTGYGENHRFPSCMKEHLNFDQLKVRWARSASPRTETAIEVWGGKQLGGSENLALSAIVTRRSYFAVRGNTALSCDFGIGAVHLQDKVQGTATRNNFTEQIGIGFHYSTGSSSAFVMEYRFCHISNAGIKLPNVGINASIFSIGHTWYR